MKMGRLGLALCVLFVFASVEAGRRKSNRFRNSRLQISLPTPPECSGVQSFEIGQKYDYEYETIIESRNNDSKNATTGKKLRCYNVSIMIPDYCVGTLSIENCTVYESTLLPNGSLVYSAAGTNIKLEKMMSKNKMYFHFNRGEINKIYYNGKSEPTDVMNFKRGILSALQFKYNSSGLDKPIHKQFQVPETNIFGTGSSMVEVTSVEGGFAKSVQLSRDLDMYELSWKRRQWATLRTAVEGSDLVDLVSDLIVDQAENITGGSNQSCVYKLQRGRHVEEVECKEFRPVNLYNNTIFKLLQLNQQGNFTAQTNIKIKLTQKRGSKLMDHKDRPHHVELARFHRYYKEESLEFEEQWEESLESIAYGFDPNEAIDVLVTRPENRTTPALFAKLARYITRCSEEKMEQIWQKIRNRYTVHELEKATNIWVQLLSGCSSAPYWCSLPQCEPSMACQNVLSKFVKTSSQSQWTENIRTGVMQAISGMPNPNITVIEAALEICTSNTTAKYLIMMGKAMARYVQHPDAELEHQVYIRARNFLAQQFQSCDVSRNEFEEKRIKIAAMKSVAALKEHGHYALQNFVQCISNSRSPKELSLTAIRSLQDMRFSDQHHRQHVLNVLEDRNRPVTVRLASYLLIVTKDPFVEEIRRISEIISRENEPRALKYYIREHIKSQVLLRNTSFCELSQTGIQNIVSVIREGSLRIDVDIDSQSYSEQRYVTKQNLTIPVVNKELECVIVSELVFARNSMVPSLVNVTISTEIGETNVTLLESKLDFSKIVAVLDPLFGKHGVFPKQDLERFLNMPISQLLGLVMRDQPYLSSDEVEKLTMIQSEGELAYSMLTLKNKSPFDVKLLGVPLTYKAILDLPLVKDIKLMNIWKIVDVFEKGWKVEGVIADQPALGHLASPSSIGWPHIFRVEANYFVHMHTKIVIPIKKIALTREGDVTVKSKPTIKGSLMWTQKVQLPMSYSSGTGYQLSAGHSSNVDGSIEIRRDHIKIDLEPVPSETEIFSIKGDNVIVNNTGIVEVEQPERECQRKCFFPSTKCSENAWYYQACIRPKLDLGLYYQSASRSQYHYLVGWKFPSTHSEQDSEPEGVYKISLESFNAWPSDDAAWSWVGRYNPEASSVEFLVESERRPKLKVDANALVYRNDVAENAHFEQFFASCNVSLRDPVHGLSPFSINKILVRKQQQSEDIRSEFESFFGFNEEEPRADQNRVTYTVESDLQLNGEEQRMSATGKLFLNKTDGGYSVQVKVKKGALIDRSNLQLCVVNLTSSRIREQEKSGFMTQARVEEMSSHFPSPLTFLNYFSGFNLKSKIVNDTQDNRNQGMVLEAYVHDSPEPYFINSYSTLMSQQHRLIESNEPSKPYTLNTTVTLNWAQLQFDVLSPNTSEIQSVQRLIIPSVSIPKRRVNIEQPEYIRISESDPEFKPVCYISKVATGVCKNGTYYFKANATKMDYKKQQQIQDKQRCLYNVDVKVTPAECPICHHVVFEMNGIKLKSEYANKTNWQGHSLLIDMHKSYLEKMPIPNKSLEIIHRYSKSRDMDQVKIGYTLRANQSDNNYFYELGYHLGDKKLSVLTNLTLPGSEPIACGLRLNVTCKECLIFTNTSFKSGFGISYNASIPQKWQQKANAGSAYDIAFDYQQQDGIQAGFGVYAEAYRNTRLIHLASSVNVSFSAGHSYLRYLYPDERYVYVTGINVTRLQEGDMTRPTIYQVAYPLSFYKGAPWMIGNWTYSVETVEQNPQLSSICNVKERCIVYTLDMVQKEQCKNFHSFYMTRGLAAPYKSANCSYQKMSVAISTHNTWNISFVFDGRNNPDFLPQQILFSSVKDNSDNMMNNISIGLARHVYPSPMQLNVSYVYTESEESSYFKLALDSKEIKTMVTKKSGRSMIANVTTHYIPLEVDCYFFADQTNREKTTIQMRKCSVYHPEFITSPWRINANGWYKSFSDNKLTLGVTNSSDEIVAAVTNMEHGRGMSRIYCGSKNDPKSPCNFVWSNNGETMAVETRVNTCYINHTTNAYLSGLSSFNILNWVVNVDTSTSIRSTRKCSLCHNCTTSISEYQFDTSVKNNKLKLVRTILNSTQWPSLRTAGSLYFHYISNDTADLDIFMSTDIQNRGKVEIGMYQGLNKPSVKLHLQDSSSSDYLEAYHFQYLQCSKNFTLVSKNLYDRDSVQQRQLTKMQTQIRSNYWPISCDEQSQLLFLLLFPQTPITPFCAKDMEVRVSYDLSKNKEVKVELDKQQSPLLTVTYDQRNQKHNIRAICKSENNPVCLLDAALSRKMLSLNTMLNMTDIKHKATVLLNIKKNQRAEEVMEFLTSANNSFVVSKQPVALNTTIRYTPEEGWYVSSKMNATKDLDNVILVEQGIIKKLRLYGKSIVILSKPRSWDVNFVKNASGSEMTAVIQISNESQIRAVYYEGENKPHAFGYQPNQPINRHIIGMHWNYTSCNEKAIFKLTRLFTSKRGRQLMIKSEADVDMWPFTQVRKFFYTPGYFSCPLCLGELQYTAIYNTTDDFKLFAEVVSGRTSLLLMNYTFGNEMQRPGYYLFGKTEMIRDVLQEYSPRMLLSSNVTIHSGQSCVFNITVERQGYGLLNFKAKQHFRYGPNNDWNQHLTLDSELLSIFFGIENKRDETVLDVKYPFKPSCNPMAFKLILRNNDFEIKNLTIRTGVSEWYIRRMIFTFVRGERSNFFGGMTMHDLDMEIRTNLHYKQPDVTRVSGDASAVFGGRWYINILDEHREKFVITWKLTPSPITKMKTLVLMKLPFIEMKMDGNATWSNKEFKHNFNSSLMLSHPLTKKLLPVFDLLVVDKLKKAQDCIYHGEMYWESNIWNPFFSDYHINPVFNALMNPRTDSTSELNIKFTMGDSSVNHTMKFSNEIQKIIPIFKNVSICVPRTVTGETTSRFRFWESSHELEITQGKYNLTSNTTMLLRLPGMYVIKPIFNCTNVMKFYLTTDNVLVGSSKYNGTMMTPTLMPFIADVTITPVSRTSGSTSRKFGMSYKLGEEHPLMFNISAPETQNRRLISARAFGSEILSSSFRKTECSLASPIMPDLLCVPREMHLENIMANLPVAHILRQFPILSMIIPNTELLNVVLRDSNMSLTTEKRNDYDWKIIYKSRMSGPSWSERIAEQMTRLNLPHFQLSRNATMNIWFVDTNITRLEEKIDFVYDSKMNSPLMDNRFRLHWISMFTIKEIVFQFKTKGIVEKYLPLDIDWEFTTDPDTKKWTFALHAYQFQLSDQIKGRISFITDSSLMNTFVSYNATLKDHPVMNHSIGLSLVKSDNTGPWSLGAWLKNAFLRVNSSSRFGDSFYKLLNVTVDVPTASNNVCVTYKFEHDKQHKLIVMVKDGEESRFVCNSTVMLNGTVTWNCSQEQLHPQQGWQQQERHFVKQQIDISPSGIFSLFKKSVSFDYDKIQNHSWIEQTLKTIFGLTDETLRRRITSYVVNETRLFKEKLRDFMRLTTMDSWNNWVINIIDIVPSLIPAEQYLDQTFGQLRYLTDDKIKMTVASGKGFLAIRYNITCPKESSDIMLQLNFTTTTHGYPVVNLSLVTPFSDQYLMLDLGSIAKPVKLGVKSFSSQYQLQMNFTCSTPGSSCAAAELVLKDERRYRCDAVKQHSTRQYATEPSWIVVCRSVYRELEEEVARFTVTSPSFIKSVKTGWYISMNYLEGHLEHYLDRIMNIPARSTFSSDLTQAVTDSYSDIKEVLFMIFPERAPMMYQLEKIAKEGAILGIEHIKKISNGTYDVSYPKLIKSTVDYLSTVNKSHGLRIPLVNFNLTFIVAKFYVELGMEGMRNVSFVLDTSVPQKPDLDQKLRADLWYAKQKSFVRCAINNNFVWSYVDICLSNESVVNASIGLPQSTKSVNMTYVGEPDAALKQYRINFVDAEGSNYECLMRQQSSEMMLTECYKQRVGQQGSRSICRFETPVEALRLDQLFVNGMLLVPEMYIAAMKPNEFKTYLRNIFGVTDDESLRIISSYLSNISHEYIERLHRDLVQLFADRITDIPSLIKQDWASPLIKKVLSHPRFIDVTRGRSSVMKASNDFISDVTPNAITGAIKVIDTLSQTCREVKVVARGFFEAFNFTFEPFTRVYSIENFVHDTYNFMKACGRIGYVCQRVMFEPQELKSAASQLYRELYISEYISSLFKLRGPMAESIIGTESNSVISFKEQTYELPIVDAASECKYLYLTEPFHNSYNIISKGRSLLLVFPNITVEMASDRRVYITVFGTERREVILPYFSDEIYCEMIKPTSVECKSMEYKVLLETGANNRVQRTVTIYLPKYAMGVLGVQSDEPTPVTKYLPDGEEAVNSPQLMNAYKLSSGRECDVSERSVSFIVEDSSCSPICEELFQSPELKDGGRIEPEMKQAYLGQCKRHCNNHNKTAACEIVNKFVEKLRSKKIFVDDVKECLPCAIHGPQTFLEKSEVYILISMSRDRIQTDPKKSIRRLANRLLEKMQQERLSESKVGVVTYGGNGNWSKPSLTAVNGLSVSGHRQNLIAAIQNINFDGPGYNPATTVDALRYISRTLKTAPSGIVKSLLVVAPETEHKNCGSMNLSSLIAEFRNDFTSVFLWSQMNNEQCQSRRVDIVRNTEGTCLRCTESSEDEMSTIVVNKLKQKTGNAVQCECETGNRLTGELKSKCVPWRLDNIRY